MSCFLLKDLIGRVASIKLKLLAYANGINAISDKKLYKNYTDTFNIMNKQQNIELDLSFYNYTSGTITPNKDFSTYNINENYDIIIYNNIYAYRLKDNFLPLDSLIPKKHIEYYENGVAFENCKFDQNVYSLPFFINFGLLFSNNAILSNYNVNKSPETWSELMETAIDIRNQIILDKNSTYFNENKPIPGYIANLTEDEDGDCALLEILYSFREDLSKGLPEYDKQATKEALKKMRQIMTSVSSPEYFKSSFKANMRNENFIYARAWDNLKLEPLHYIKKSRLPGRFNGISASCINGVNISINKEVENQEEKKIAASTVVQFFTSSYNQRLLILNYAKHSAITSLYDKNKHSHICGNYNCPLYNSLQKIVRPANDYRYDMHSKRLREYIYEYIYGKEGSVNDELLDKILQDVINITKIYSFKIVSLPGIIILVGIVLCMNFIISSFFYVYSNRFKKHFSFMPFSYWCIFFLGLVLLSCYPLTGFETLTLYHCRARPLLLSLGVTMVNLPFILGVISQRPDNNKFLYKLLKKCIPLFFLLILLLDLAFNFLWYYYGDISIETVYLEDRNKNNYNRCNFYSSNNTLFKIILFSLKLSLLLVMTYVLNTEKNLQEVNHIRTVGPTTLIEAIGLIGYSVAAFLQHKNLYFDFGVKCIILFVEILLILFLIIGTKVYSISIKKKQRFSTLTSRYNYKRKPLKKFNYVNTSDSSLQYDSTPYNSSTEFSTTIKFSDSQQTMNSKISSTSKRINYNLLGSDPSRSYDDLLKHSFLNGDNLSPAI